MQRTRAWMPAIAPAVVALGLLAWGRPERAALAAALAVAMAVLVALGVDVAGAVARAAHAAGRALALVAAMVTFALVVLPGWAWTRTFRRDPLQHGATPSWARTTTVADRPTSLGSAPGVAVRRRGLLRQALWVVECVALVLALNYGLGWAFDAASGRTGPDSLALALDRDTGGVDADPRVDSPAMASAPWRERYFADLQRTTGGYWPFTEFRPEPFESPYLNIDGWTRRSWQPAPGDAPRPLVWIYGGSTAFGEGQRDEYTIASWLARFAEQDGIPIDVANFGQRGWTHFQEMVLFEQRLELEPPPDLAVFYDGANELAAQALLTEPVPSNTSVLQFAERMAGATVATRFVQDGVATTPSDDLWFSYTQHSLAHKVVHAFAPDAAGATEAQTDPTPDDGIDEDGARPNPTVGIDFAVTPQDGTDAGHVYERSKRITEGIAAEHRVPVRFFWQPVASHTEAERRALALLTPSTVDLSRILDDHPDVYIDGVHTNEEGARLAAVAIWSHIRPDVARWYAQHR